MYTRDSRVKKSIIDFSEIESDYFFWRRLLLLLFNVVVVVVEEKGIVVVAWYCSLVL